MLSTLKALAGLACIFETFGSDENSLEETGVVVEGISNGEDFLIVTIADKDGNEKTFQIIEVDP